MGAGVNRRGGEPGHLIKQQPECGVSKGALREPHVAVPDQLHGDARRNACSCEHAAEGVAQGVEIRDAAQIIAEGAALVSHHPIEEGEGKAQVFVQDFVRNTDNS